MGRARSDGYRFENSSRPGPRTSTSNGTPAAPSSNHRPSTSSSSGATRTWGSGRSREGHRVSRNRRPRDRGCRNKQVRQGIASVIFVLGIPCLIAGLILTIVSSDDGEESNKYPSSFNVAGPLLLALSVICFAVGVLLYNVVILQKLRDCMNLSDKDSFFRVHCPRLSGWIKPDTVAALNRAAINNLQTAPARSAMRKMPNPDLVALETGEGHAQDHPQGEEGHHYQGRDHHDSHQRYPPARRKRAVTFSEGDGDLDVAFAGLSTSSEPDRISVHSENGGGGGGGLTGSLNGHSPSSSLLSLRHCKIHPRDDVFWTDSSGDGSGGGEGGGAKTEGEGRGGGHPAASDAISVVDSGGDGGCGSGGVKGEIGVPVKFALTEIDEEPV
ncbi:uncharacterized protein [Littorina saxatilis]|uniref:Uncharacterized protein n=1 Tax=Littorina saxatilis TaxID=31220 RepID=A0AAN9BUA6_9CAEN